MPSKTFTVRMSTDLLDRIEEARGDQSRNAFIARAVEDRLRHPSAPIPTPQPQRRPETPPKPAQMSDLPPNAKLLLAHLRKRGECSRRDVMRALSWGEEQLLPAVVSLRGMIRTKGSTLDVIE